MLKRILTYNIKKDALFFCFLLLLTAKLYSFYALIGFNPFRMPFPWYLATIPGIVLLLLSFSFLLQKRGRVIYVFLIDILISALIVVNLWHYRYFDAPLTISSLKQLHDVLDMKGALFAVINSADALFVCDLFAFPLVLRLHQGGGKNIGKCLSALFAGIFLFLTGPLGITNIEHNHAFPEADSNLYFLQYTPVLSGIYEFLFIHRNLSLDLTPKLRHSIAKWLVLNRELIQEKSESKNPYRGLGRGKNLIFIQGEGLDALVIGKRINGQEITPNINRMLKNSIYFNRIYSQVAGGHTSDVEFMVNTSLYPLINYCVFYLFPANQYLSLPLLLCDHGYASVAIHGNRANYWNRHIAIPALGFDRFISYKDLKGGEVLRVNLGVSDEAVFQQAADILSQLPKPFYAHIITLSSHYPYDVSDKRNWGLLLRSNGELKDALLVNFLQEIHLLDKAVGHFLEKLQERQLLNKSVIVILGDHNALPEQEVLRIAKKDSRGKYRELRLEDYKHKQVPFLVYQPSLKGIVRQTLGGTIDVYPTIADIMDIDEDEYGEYVIGRNLLTTRENFVVLMRGGFMGVSKHADAKKVMTVISDDEFKNTKGEDRVFEGIRKSEKIIRSNFFAGSVDDRVRVRGHE